MKRKVLAPSIRQPLNGQGMLRIPGLKIHKEKVEKRIGVRFGKLECWQYIWQRNEGVQRTEKRQVDVYCLQEVRWRGEGARFLASREEGTNYGGVERMIRLEAWVYW